MRAHYLAAVAVLWGMTGCASQQANSSDAPASLPGTNWRVIGFQGGDGTVLTPDDPAKYTFAFDANGQVSVRIDCNRGRGPYKSAEPGKVEFGPLALTRAICKPPSMHDQIVKQLPHIRSYQIRAGHLFLALMADGGIYELERTGSL